MATNWYSDAWKAGAPDSNVPSGMLLAQHTKISVTAGTDVDANDVIYLFKVPAGAIVIDVIVGWSAGTSGGQFDLGDDDDSNYYMDSIVVTYLGKTSCLGGVTNSNTVVTPTIQSACYTVGRTYSAETSIIMTVTDQVLPAAMVIDAVILYVMGTNVDHTTSIGA